MNFIGRALGKYNELPKAGVRKGTSCPAKCCKISHQQKPEKFGAYQSVNRQAQFQLRNKSVGGIIYEAYRVERWSFELMK